MSTWTASYRGPGGTKADVVCVSWEAGANALRGLVECAHPVGRYRQCVEQLRAAREGEVFSMTSYVGPASSRYEFTLEPASADDPEEWPEVIQDQRQMELFAHA
jgi:hypothetical protein